MEQKRGKLTFLSDDSGIGIIRIEEKRYTFAYDQIAKYKGQSFKELGFIEGKTLGFELEGRNIVNVHLAK